MRLVLKQVFQALFIVPLFTLAVVLAVICGVLFDLASPHRKQAAKRRRV